MLVQLWGIKDTQTCGSHCRYQQQCVYPRDTAVPLLPRHTHSSSDRVHRQPLTATGKIISVIPLSPHFPHHHMCTCHQQLHSKCRSGTGRVKSACSASTVALFSCGTKAQARWNGFLSLDLRVYVMDDTSIKQVCTHRED